MASSETHVPSDVKKLLLPGNPGKLNVILHGLFTFFQTSDGITAFIPNMGSEHVYRAGNWLAETALAQQADYTLVGVDPGGLATFNPQSNIILKDATLSDVNCCDRVYATLHFPVPDAIYSVGQLTIGGDKIGGDSAVKIDGLPANPAQRSGTTLHSSSVQIFTYNFSSDAELRLGQHPWEPVFEDGFVNLHIFSEPERTPDQDHVRHAFQMSTGLFTGIDLSMRGPMNPEGQTPVLPGGVDPLELQGLIRRQRWLGVLGRGIKEGRDINGIWDDPTSFDGGDPNTCPPGGIGTRPSGR